MCTISFTPQKENIISLKENQITRSSGTLIDEDTQMVWINTRWISIEDFVAHQLCKRIISPKITGLRKLIRHAIANIISLDCLENHFFLIAIYYIEKAGIDVTLGNAFSIYMTCLLLAFKFLADFHYENVVLVRIWDIALKEFDIPIDKFMHGFLVVKDDHLKTFNQFEAYILQRLDFNAFVSMKLLKEYIHNQDLQGFNNVLQDNNNSIHTQKSMDNPPQ
jgi:hypothetical protein